MSYGYLGDTSTSIKQQVKNAGVLSVSDVLDLEGKGQLGGSLELIEEIDLSSSTKGIFSSIHEDVYDVHFLTVENVTMSSSGKVYLRLYESGVEETGAVYQYANLLIESDSSLTSRQATGDSLLFDSTNTFGAVNFYVYCYQFGNSAKHSLVSYHGSDWDGKSSNYYGGAIMPQTSVVDGISVNATQTMQTGTAKLFGIKQI